MPTDLPARRATSDERGNEGAQVLLTFYGVLVLVGSLLIAAETRLGMFDGMTTAQAVLAATSTQGRSAAEPWLPVSP